MSEVQSECVMNGAGSHVVLGACGLEAVVMSDTRLSRQTLTRCARLICAEHRGSTAGMAGMAAVVSRARVCAVLGAACACRMRCLCSCA